MSSATTRLRSLTRRSTTPVLRWTVIVSAVALILGGVAAVTYSAGPATSEPGGSGACRAHEVIGFAGGAEMMALPDDVLDRELDAMYAMGARWIRIGVEWDAVEQRFGKYDWTIPDRIINRAVAKGFTVLGVVLTTPPWARSPGAAQSPHALPAVPLLFARFAGDAAARYRGKISEWEIWNEPNIIVFAKPKPSVFQYNLMLVNAALAIRARAPGARIVSGGLAPAGDDGTNIAPTTFLRQLYALGGRNAWDFVGMHPYTYPAQPDDLSTVGWNAYLRLDIIRDIINSNGDGRKQIWITEFGAPTAGDPSRAVSPEAQAQAISTVIRRAMSDPLIGPVIIHNNRDRGTDPNNIEHHFGLTNVDFSPKPAYTALQQIARC